MPLSESAQNLNSKTLDEIISIVAKLFANDHINEKLAAMKKKILAILDQKEFILSIPDGKERLQTLLTDTVPYNNDDDFSNRLAAWAEDYGLLQIKANERLRAQAAAQVNDVCNAVSTNSFAMKTVWGSDRDIKTVLRGIIKTPHDVKEEVEILTPVSLVPGANASEIENDLPGVILLKHISMAIENHPGKKMTLVIPVNCGESHWRLAIVKIKDKKIKTATLWDSLAPYSYYLLVTDAYKTMQKVVDQINGNSRIKVEPVSSGKQGNGYSCMDYIIQKALKIKFPFFSSKKQLSKDLKDLLSADYADEIREAIIRVIRLNTLDLRNAAQAGGGFGLFDRHDEPGEKLKMTDLTDLNSVLRP